MPPAKPTKPKAVAKAKTCLWDKQPVSTRGLCLACYRNLARKASGNPVKWKEFEDAGLCLPRKTKASCGVLKRIAELESQAK